VIKQFVDQSKTVVLLLPSCLGVDKKNRDVVLTHKGNEPFISVRLLAYSLQTLLCYGEGLHALLNDFLWGSKSATIVLLLLFQLGEFLIRILGKFHGMFHFLQLFGCEESTEGIWQPLLPAITPARPTLLSTITVNTDTSIKTETGQVKPKKIGGDISRRAVDDWPNIVGKAPRAASL
jgi:hypothetical protein